MMSSGPVFVGYLEESKVLLISTVNFYYVMP
jgi:hypothetical protein